MTGKKDSKAKNIPQIFTFFFFAFWLKYILRLEIKGAEKIDIQKPLIIVSNHCSRLDPFIILSAMGWKNFLKINPLRFPLDKIYAESRWLGPISRLIGCYKIEGKGDLSQSLESTFDVIDQNYSLIYFPEGQVVKKNESIEPKRGIGYICEKRNVSIFPVRISPNGYNKKRTGKVRGSKIFFGKSFNSRDLRKKDKIANLHLVVMERVIELK
jgi:1-acyl-sn-glycerol-3-phosphate acyltransferase